MAINVKDKLVTLESLGVAYSAEQDAREEADQALSTRIDNIVAPEGDPSLTEVSDARVSGSTTHNTLKARLDADKAAVETEISQLSADLNAIVPGLSEEAKQALLECFNNVVWEHNNKTHFNTLKLALESIPIAPVYSLQNITYEIGAIGITSVYGTPGDASSILRNYRMTYDSDNLDTRARMHSLFPVEYGDIITACEGYELVVYQFAGIDFRSHNRNSDDTQNPHGRYLCLDSMASVPQWGTSHTISNRECKYFLAAFRKTDQSAWTQDEMTNFYGTVFTAALSSQHRLFDIAEYVGGRTFGGGDIVIPGTNDRYVQEQVMDARAIMRYVPVTNGIFKSADASKYKISVYQINSIGAFIKDTSNPHNSANWPDWADQYTVYLPETSAVCISFKKMDGTNFTSDELENMYGTVFTYERG